MDHRPGYGGSYSGINSTSGLGSKYGATQQSRYTTNGGASRINQSSTYTCHYCNKGFPFQYDLNNHFVYCPKRTGNYSAGERGLNKTDTQINTSMMSTAMSHDIKDPLTFDPSTPQFGLINSYKHNQLNCFMNAVLQMIWNIDALKTSVLELSKLDLAGKDGPSDEEKLMMEIQHLFKEANA